MIRNHFDIQWAVYEVTGLLLPPPSFIEPLLNARGRVISVSLFWIWDGATPYTLYVHEDSEDARYWLPYWLPKHDPEKSLDLWMSLFPLKCEKDGPPRRPRSFPTEEKVRQAIVGLPLLHCNANPDAT